MRGVECRQDPGLNPASSVFDIAQAVATSHPAPSVLTEPRDRYQSEVRGSSVQKAPHGSGKSTLMRRLYRFLSGDAEAREHALSFRFIPDGGRSTRVSVGFVPQDAQEAWNELIRLCREKIK